MLFFPVDIKESGPIEDPASRRMIKCWSRGGKAWSVGIVEYWVKKIVFPFLHHSIIPIFQTKYKINTLLTLR